MAIIKLNEGRGMRGMEAAVPVAEEAGDVQAIRVTHVCTAEGIGTGDILEIAALPAYAVPLKVIINTEGAPATNLTLGIMSGEINSADPARTSGSELFNATAAGTEASATLLSLMAVKASAGNRSIGLKTSAAIPKGAAKIHLIVQYAQAGGGAA